MREYGERPASTARILYMPWTFQDNKSWTSATYGLGIITKGCLIQLISKGPFFLLQYYINIPKPGPCYYSVFTTPDLEASRFSISISGDHMNYVHRAILRGLR